MSTIQHYNKTFLHELDRLNPAQREAVEQIEGDFQIVFPLTKGNGGRFEVVLDTVEVGIEEDIRPLDGTVKGRADADTLGTDGKFKQRRVGQVQLV